MKKGHRAKLNLAGRKRSCGFSIILLVSILGLVVLPLIAIFAFEISRANLGAQQLKNAADAAALAAVATMASQDNKNLVSAQDNAKKVALNIFKANSVLGQSLASSSLGSSVTASPAELQGEIFIQFLDPNTMSPVADGDPDGKVVRLSASYGMVPAFGKFVGIGKHVIVAASNGAVPQLDVVVCFDVSGSIDDQTPVTIVKRQWDDVPDPDRIVYKDPVAPKTKGKIFDIVQPPATGTRLNGVPPQNLLEANSGYAGLYFSEKAKSKSALGMRSGNVFPEAGRAPGNFYGAPTLDSDSSIFTDMVVNIDGNDTFGGVTTADGFAFPDVATLVEASRGNLESTALMDSSKASTALSVSAKSGYQAAYFREAIAHLQPIQDAKDAVSLFCQILNNDTDAHFSLVTFDGEVGADENTCENHNMIDDSTPYGSTIPVPCPLIPLDSGIGNSQFNKVLTALGAGINGRPCVARGSTNIGKAISTAVSELTSHQRINSVRAIILFTDGQPTAGQPLDSDAWKNARLAAVQAKNAGIPVYTIGLATNPTVADGQNKILNDTDSNPNSSTGGIAAISGSGAVYHQVTSSSQLRAAFQKIARKLVQLVHDQLNE